jgi:hypothetical protein
MELEAEPLKWHYKTELCNERSLTRQSFVTSDR